MGWKGTIRSLNASIKRSEREAQKNRNANIRLQQKQEKEFKQMQLAIERQLAFNNAADEVKEFENHLNALITLHVKTSKYIDWLELSISSKPNPPIMSYENKNIAVNAYETFSPNFFQKLFKRTNKIKKLLQQKIEIAENTDKELYKQSIKKFDLKLSEWKKDIELSKKVLSYDEESFNHILQNRSELPLACLKYKLDIKEDKLLRISIYINGQEIVPTEVKLLLKSGKVSTKKMSKTKYYEIYQDYVCSILFKVAREVFALLPVKETVITIFDHILDQSTAYLRDIPILSSLMINETINKLNIDKIDPSEALKNFSHNMSFKKTTGFEPVEILKEN
ncbi:hypothetical protein DES39_0092 [Orbus hercynius]|uniref:Uncharacterized protein n=1 Tax=Orbus hercynius TaxID=593135 RepID=A0A495RJB6_9GAMM|nr:hypothetical protein [Orbus hercynius]RKS86888.1 hypothetical protein DES39_0092 [Orbus hercynius]